MNSSGQSMHTPSTRRRFLWPVLAAILQLVFLLWVARTAVPQALTCEVCDTAYYLAAAENFTKTGLREELVRLQKQGWTYDGAKGDVYPFP